jgi:hypothetical protein
MEISPSNAPLRKENSGGVEDEAGASCDPMPAQAGRWQYRCTVVRWRRARGVEPEEEDEVG